MGDMGLVFFPFHTLTPRVFWKLGNPPSFEAFQDQLREQAMEASKNKDLVKAKEEWHIGGLVGVNMDPKRRFLVTKNRSQQK